MAKIAFSGDWHGDLGWGLACLKTAKEEGASLLVQAGDIAVEWPGIHKSRMADRLSRGAKQVGIPIVAIRGNHDNVDALFPLEPEPEGYAKLREWVWYLPDGARFEWEGVMIGALGGATSNDKTWRVLDEQRRKKPRTLWWPQEVVSRDAAVRLVEAGPLDVLVTHEMPAGDWFDEYPKREGSPEYERSAMIDREIIASVRAQTHPRLQVFGHWHRRRSIIAGQHDHGRYLLEGLGMNGDRLGNMIIWDSFKHKTYNPEVKWGRKE